MPSRIAEYDRAAAVSYAHKWAFSRNPDYYDYEEIGGDCTNFSSQCIFAGAKIMNYSGTFGWYYSDANNKSPSWTGVQFLRNFLINNKSEPGPFAKEVTMEEIMPGDIIQLAFDGGPFQHSPFVVKTGTVPRLSNILTASHTFNTDYKPIDTYDYSNIRFLHITGVRN
jgi:hypothetical protein